MAMIKIIRFILGYLIVLLNFVFRPKQVKRLVEEQAKVDKDCQSLALYQFYLCPFCVHVRRHITRLNLKIETRDAKRSDSHKDALIKGGGKHKVPCLRIESEGSVTWLYESADIVAYLDKRFYKT